MSFFRGLGRVAGGFLQQGAPVMADLAGRGIMALGKSIAASLTCSWYKDGNSLLRFTVGSDAYNTERHTLVHADSQMVFEAVKWFVEVQGSPYDASESFPDGRRPTMIGLVIYVQQYRAPEGILSLDTYEESGASSDQGSLMYSEKDDVVIGNFFRLWGFDSEFAMEGGFKNGANPGPILLQPRDTIRLAAIATDDFSHPQRTQSNVKGFITGTFTYRLHTAV